jgi:hypothetical protein
LNNTFTKDTGAAWNAGTDSTTDSRFKVVDTICEANYHYEHRDTYPGPGQINGFLYDQVRGSTGQVMVAASRKFGIDYPAYTLKTSLFPPVEEGIAAPGYISTYTIKPIGDNGIISPLIGGATNTSVYDDYNRVPRAGIKQNPTPKSGVFYWECGGFISYLNALREDDLLVVPSERLAHPDPRVPEQHGQSMQHHGHCEELRRKLRARVQAKDQEISYRAIPKDSMKLNMFLLFC